MAIPNGCAFAPKLALAILAATVIPPAYTQTTPAWIVVSSTRVRPDARAEYESYVKQLSAAYKKAGVPFFVVLTNVAGDLNEYTTVRPVTTFAELDSGGPVEKTLGADAYANLVGAIRRCTTSQVRVFERTMPDLGIDDRSPLGTVWMRTTYSVVTGKGTEFSNFIKSEYKPALQKVGVGHYLVSAPTFGSGGNEYVTMRLMKNFAEIDGGPVTNKLGAEAAAALNGKLNGLARVTSRRLMRVRTEMSYMPAQN